VEVEKAGSITKAAERLYINQPQLTKKIRELEESIGGAIFERTSKGITPTQKGVEFLAYARNLLEQVEKMENLFKSDTPRISFRIAVPRASYVSYTFTQFINTLDSNARLDIDYMETNSISILEHVVDGSRNLGIVRIKAAYSSYFEDIFRDKNLHYEPICEFEYLVLLSRNHPLANELVVKYEDLCNFVKITHGDAEFPFIPHQNFHETGGIPKRDIAIYERGSQLEILQRIPISYMWVSPMPSVVLSTFSLLQKKSDLPNNNHVDFLVSRRGYRFTEEDNVFLKLLHDTVAEINSRIP
jgi:DNA-binding transcriptional LysR family regulator